MAIGKRLKSLVDKLRPVEAPASPWRPTGVPYPLLATLDPASAGLAKVAGIIAIWHLGVRPQWLKIAATKDISITLRSAVQARAILSYRPNGGVYVAWAPLPVTDLRGQAQHLRDHLKPLLQATRLEAEIDAVTDKMLVAFPFPPGTLE